MIFLFVFLSLDFNMSGLNPNVAEWKLLYPIYVDRSASRLDGREIAKEFCIDSPTALELELALRTMGFPCKYEDKRHPATPFMPGRVRVLYKKVDGSEVYPGVTSKLDLLKKITEVIPTLKHRVDAQKAIELQQQQLQKEQNPQKSKNTGRRRR